MNFIRTKKIKVVKIKSMNRPRLLINVAMTVNGKIDRATRNGAPISSAADKTRVYQLHAGVDAVLISGHTLLNEDPELTVKSALNSFGGTCDIAFRNI